MSAHRKEAHALLPATVRWWGAALVSGSGMLVALPAQAASLQAVTTSAWASGVPSYISMSIYVPSPLASPPPIVVASHYCGGSASAYFGYVSNVVSLANQFGFIMIFPQTTNPEPAPNGACWDVGSAKSLTRDGGGDTQAIVEMVQYAITQYKADASRVYAMGSSSGAMMTEALMGLYPDVFKAGAEMSGVPDGCWAVGYSGNWSNMCATGAVSMTGPQWGNIVRAQFPGYTGPRPRVWLWVGTADTTISPNNFGQALTEWTNVLGLSATPTSTQTPSTGYTGQLWSNSCGQTVLEGWTLQNGPHAPMPTTENASQIVDFFALNQTGPDPDAAGCGDGGAASGSSGGSSSSGGGSSSSSSSGSGGRSSSSSSGSSSSSSGSGGRSSSSSGSSGGSSGSSGAIGTTSSGGSSGGAGSSGTIGTTSSGGSSGSAGSSGQNGTSSSGASSSSGSGDAGSSSNGTSGDAPEPAAGCGCHMGPSGERFGMVLAPVGALLGILLRRRRRPRA
jgi:acetylxylan esterase